MIDVKSAITIGWLSTAVITGLIVTHSLARADGSGGEDGFKEHCAACHADGGNIIKADKTLSRSDRERHGIKSPGDIVRLMRKPGEGMTTFDATAISDKQAHAIAEYIVATFK